jgi:outer membrane protein insertion porin family
VAEVVVSGAEGELQDEVYRAIQTQPGRTTTRSQLQEDINAVFATGFFSNVRAQPEDTPLGVRVTFIVEPNPVLRSVRLEGNRVLTQAEIDKIFSPQYGQILNFRRLQTAIRQVNQTYQDRGFVLGQVVGAPKVDPNGTVTLDVAEGVVEDIQIRFLNKEDQPTPGKTREFIITRELTLEPGEAFNRNEFQRDLQRVYGLGIFEDVQVALEPGQDPRKVIVVLNVKERKTGTFGFGAGISSASGLFGTVSYQEQNLGGNNQKLGGEVQLSSRGEFLFDVSFTDPWIGGDPYRTSYTVNLFNRLTRPFVFDGGDRDVNLPPDFIPPEDRDPPNTGPAFDDGDDPRVNRLGAGVTFSRPLSQGLLQGWTASVGLQYQRVSIRDSDFDIAPVACINPPSCTRTEQLSFSGTGQDDLTSLQAGLVRDLRDDPLRPTRGSLLRLSTQQYVPIGLGNILGNKLIGSYSYYIPVRFTNFNEGPQALAFNLQAGTVVGDLPPYEAFSLGGSNSVRGYGEGELGTGRSYVQFSAEYRFPLFSIVGGALFLDAASDLGTASSVLGEPAVIREKPGSGFGYGIGVRVQTPLGPIRVDYGLNNEGDSRIHFGIGERF